MCVCAFFLLIFQQRLEDLDFTHYYMNVVFKNIRGLLILQILCYVFPLIVVPYVSRVVGPSYLGKINFSQSYINYFLLIINFGFDFTATKRISIIKDDRKALIETFNEVISAKIVLFVLSLIVFAVLTYSYPVLRKDLMLHCYSFLFCIGGVFLPVWFFQGIQEIQQLSYITLIIKLLTSISIIVLVVSPETYYWFAICTSGIQVIGGVVTYFIAVKKYKIPFYFTGLARIWELINSEKLFFLSTVVIHLYTTTNIFLLGLFVEAKEVGIYTASVKLISIVSSVCITPISQAFFPEIANRLNKDKSEGLAMVQRLIPLVFFLTLSGSIVLYGFAPFIVKTIYGNKFIEAISVFQYLCVIPILSSLSMFQAQVMLSLKLDKYIFYISLSAGIISVCVNLLLIKQYSYYASAIAYILVEVFILLVGFIVLQQQNLAVLIPRQFGFSTVKKSVMELIKNKHL